jgi:cobalamin biosynthetic protein CobC
MGTTESIPDGANELPYHGGAIDAARRLYPDAPEPWIDLSTGLNPLPYPVDSIAPSAWSKLPEASDLAALEATARAAYGAQLSAGVVAAPGTQALLQWLPRLFPARHVGVLGFTYAEHQRCWQAAGAEVAVVATLSDLASFDVGIVVNPNNPDGRAFSPEDLTGTAAALAQRGGRLIVDEAFMDVLGRQASLVPRLPTHDALVLRSFGKFYGLGGLRLGFALASPQVCTQLRTAMGPWAVSGPAIEIGRRALGDATWITETTGRLSRDANRLDRILQSAGFDIVGGTSLFRLALKREAGAMFRQLCRAGILTRPFQARPHWLRFGLPHGPAAWDRLAVALPATSVENSSTA